jgi:hypothetical protein
MNSAILTIILTIISALLAYILARERSRAEIKAKEAEAKAKEAEAKATELKSIQLTLTTYDKMLKINTQRLEEQIKEGQKTRVEILRLKKIVTSLVIDSCKVHPCANRIIYGKNDISSKTKDVPDCIIDVDGN